MALLSVAETREHITTELGDTALGRIIDACQVDLDRWAGPITESGAVQSVTETVYARRMTLLPLRRVPATVTTVTDIVGTTETVLVTGTDWRIRDADLERVATSPTGGFWGDRTVVVYTPADDRALRRRALVKLIQLELNHAPGVGSRGSGDFNQSFLGNYEAERQAILDTIRQLALLA